MPWPVNARTSAMMDEAQALYGAIITATQGSPSTSVGASAGTHAGQGVIDVVGADLDAIVIAMRQVGFAAWHRTPAQGFTPHVHGVAVGEPLLSSQAATQVQSYLAGYNGLRGNGLDDGPRDWVGITWETYTGGTYIPPASGGGTGPQVTIYGQFPGDRSGGYAYFPGGILTGSPTVSGTSDWTISGIDDDPPPAILHMEAGDSCVVAILEDWNYYRQEETLSAGMYMIRSTGGGTLTLADAWDDGYYYPDQNPSAPWTPWVPQERIGSDGEFDYYTASSDLLDESHLSIDGWPIVRLTCTSGSLDISWVGMQIEGTAGIFVDAGGFVWSAGQSSGITYGYPGDPSFNADPSGTYWTVDGTPILKFPDFGPSDPNEGRKSADARSYVDLDDALDLRDADYHVAHGGGTGHQYISTTYSDGIGIFPSPESWRGTIDDMPAQYSAPTKNYAPARPPDMTYLPYLTNGEFEYIDTDTGFRGYQIGPSDEMLGYRGDAGMVTLLANFFSGSAPDSLDVDYYNGMVITTLEKTTNDNLHTGENDPAGGGEVRTGIELTVIETSDNMMVLSLDCTIRTLHALVHTGMPSGFLSIQAITASQCALINLPVYYRFRVPTYRYKIPTFTSVPGPAPVIDFDEDPTVLWLRQRQRNDGLGNSVIRAKGRSSRQRSIRQRGYR